MAVMSKPMVITLPVVMILLDFWPLGRFKSGIGRALRWQLKEKVPFFILSAVTFFIIITSPQPDWDRFPFYSRLMNGPVAFIIYLEKTLWPHDVAVFYPFPAHIPLWQVAGSVALLVLITAFVIVTAKRMPYLIVGWLWFVLAIFPVSGILYQIWLCAMADRYHYLPSIGIAIMLAWGIGSLFSGEDVRRKILFPAGILFLAILSFITWKQCGYWKNSYALFNHALRVTENNYLAHNNLGLALASRGKFNDAIYHYTLALRLKPYHLQSLNNRGLASYAVRDYRDALRDYNKVIGINPNIADTYYNRGLVYTSLGLNWKAIEDYNKSVSLNPDFANAYNNRAFVFVRLGDYGRAAADYNTVLRLNPRHADALNNRAFVYLQTGNIETGCLDAQKACAMGVCLTLEAYHKQGYCR
jgi:tetratricopeptide (TPR) repeat protein